MARSFTGFRRKVLQVAGGTAVAQGLLVVASPVLTRLYTPADFGVLVVHVSLVSILVTVASLRLELALPLPERATDAAALLLLCVLLVVATTALGGLAMRPTLYLNMRSVVTWMCSTVMS